MTDREQTPKKEKRQEAANWPAPVVVCGRCGCTMIRDPWGWQCHSCGSSK